MKIDNAHERLNSLWGRIDERHNSLIAEKLRGKRILDIGCGYGSLVNYLVARGFEAEGWDHDPESVAVAHELFPGVPVKHVDAEREATMPANTFDSVVLKDSLHHLAGEGDVDVSFANIRRLLKPGGRIVILDPNPMPILRVARKLARHHDPEATSTFALRLLKEQGFTVGGIRYHETIGLPLSGGYVGVRFVPNVRPLNALVSWANDALSRVANAAGVGASVCWRYVIHADARA